MPEFSVRGRHVVVVGAARSGIAAARLLIEKGARVLLADTKTTLPGAAELRAEGLELALGTHDPQVFRSADLVVLSPGVPPWQPVLEDARRAGVPVIAELELASRWLQGRIVAITGTKGKSTTTTLVGEMLRAGGLNAVVGGNLGPAASLQVAQTAPDVVHVLETSSFQLELTDTFRPDVAVFLNISPDHLDRHRSLEAYVRAKARIFANQRQDDLAIVNADDVEVVRLADSAKAPRRMFSRERVPDDGVGIDGAVIVRDLAGARRPLVPVKSVRVLGRHLLSDVIAAATVADAFEISARDMTAVVESFNGLEHALEFVSMVRGVTFVNDSKATNVDAARHALEAFDRKVVPIMGGRFKGGDLRGLAAALTARASALVAIGESRALFTEQLGDVVDVIEADSLREAVRRAWQRAGAGGTVLLAPACASFDMFSDYAERGRAFKAEVALLKSEVDADAGEP